METFTRSRFLTTAIALFLLSATACNHRQSKNSSTEEGLAQLDDVSTENDLESTTDGDVKASEKNQDLVSLLGSEGSTGDETKKAEELSASATENSEKIAALMDTDAKAPAAVESNEKKVEALVDSELAVSEGKTPPLLVAGDTKVTITTEPTSPTVSTETSPIPTTVDIKPDTTTSDTETAPVKPARRKRAKTASPVDAFDTSLQILRQGKTMNRFYFIRKGDTAEKLAVLFYGNTERANDLVLWNGPVNKWDAGDMIFYVSPQKPDEVQLRSFYEERSITPVSYEVKRGDLLPKLAQIQYQARGSWKEIAMVNALSQSGVYPGQKINLYPVDLSPFAYAAANAAPAPSVATIREPRAVRAATSVMKPEEIQAPQTTTDNPAAVAAVDLSASSAPTDKKVSVTEIERTKEDTLASPEVAKPGSDLPWVALFAGVLTFFGILYFLVLRKTRADIGTGDDV